MRVTFVQSVNKFFADTQMFGIHFMPVWAYTLAAHLEGDKDIELRLYDERFEARENVQEADVFLFTGINQDYAAIVDMNKYLRSKFPGARFIIGGPICWSFHTGGKIQLLDMFDHIFVGDGENVIGRLVSDLKAGKPFPRITNTTERFDLTQALPMNDALMRATIHRYYGAVLEVSRGCPFLCEFCDIRILPDNNRSHVKKAELIVSEIDRMVGVGVKQVLFACDNFIGNPGWAEEVCDSIIAWKERTGRKLSLYTWLTIDVSRHPRLLQKLRLAGFDMFFIGVESFNGSSLLETAKVQNTSLSLVNALQAVQSYGFIVVAGLIFGFDSDPDDIVRITLNGIREAGLISGDPSLLTALPGTPLYKRMQLSGRLRDVKLGLGGFKYQTNIKYLKTVGQIRSDFKTFVREFNRGSYQFQRLLSFFSNVDSPNYMTPQTSGYADLRRLLKMTARNLRHIHLLVLRFFRLFRSPERSFFILRAFLFTWRHSTAEKPLWFYFKFWLFNWSNSMVKYSGLSDKDFDVDSVGEHFAIKDVLPASYNDNVIELIPANKVRAQRKVTTEALKTLMIKKGSK